MGMDRDEAAVLGVSSGGGGAVVRLVTDRDAVDEGVLSVLREALDEAERGEVRSVVCFRIMQDGERVVTYTTDGATMLVGALMQAAISVGRLDD